MTNAPDAPKRPVGRPRQDRNRRIAVLLNDDEHAQIRALAAELGLNASTYLRRCALGGVK